ncbi:uncharacterized protein LOC131183257 [Hevea brasiliensis]|uniref:uncharacterized protein LOC131183257 n=1 Tax=Hevea brasiliensis TaxID=3981 RepID=UPI0025F20B55|nr:uncharacterized protein LOC131183257 [Hevea brasiliensis]
MGKSLRDVDGMPLPDSSLIKDSGNCLLNEELEDDPLDKSLRDIPLSRYENSCEKPFKGLSPFFKIYELKQNMRPHSKRVNNSKAAGFASFDICLLQIGDGSFYDDVHEYLIQLPSDINLESVEDLMKCIVEAVYPSLLDKYCDPAYLKERAILKPKNEMVHELNEMIMNLIPGEERTYFSLDNICKASVNMNDKNLLHPIEFLNRLKFVGIPNHDICLKT